METHRLNRHVVIIGSGVGGLATAGLLAKQGYSVEVFEKNEQLGGRLSVLKKDGFTFDMGPSWYLMPDIFEQFFGLMGEKVEDYLDLRHLSPSYRIFFKDDGAVRDFFPDVEKNRPTFEAMEPGSAQKLDAYLLKAKRSYEVSKQWFLYKNYDSITDFFTWRGMIEGSRLPVIRSMHSYVSGQFVSEQVQKVLEYQLVFLGTSPYQAPALYSLMNHIDFNVGVFYPMGGMGELTSALVRMAEKHGVTFHLNVPVHEIVVEQGRAVGVRLGDGRIVEADVVVSNADIAFTEQFLLAEAHRDHSKEYWDSRTMSPSAYLLYLGVKGKIPQLLHHNLIFCKDWKQNFAEIFDEATWPNDPSIYVSMTSVTDPTVAPPDHENIVVLVPIAPDLRYTPADLARYQEKTLATIAEVMKIEDFQERIVSKTTFCVKDFAERYNSFKGSALGLAHTLRQTAVFRPNNISKKVKGLYYVGANTNPGIGVPMCLISAELVLKRLEGIKTDTPMPPSPTTQTR